jgi:hypothetical protein
MKKTGTKDNMIEKNLSVSDTAVVSDLSGETTFDNSITLTETNTTINTNCVSATKSNTGGQTKGTMAAAKVAKENL